MAFIPYDKVTDVKTGDIYISKCNYPLIKHYAVAFHRNGIPYIANRWTELAVIPLDKYISDREMIGIIRDDKTMAVTDAQIEDAITKTRSWDWKLFRWNCFDWVRFATDYHFDTDQRLNAAFIAVAIIFVIVIIAI